MVAQNYQAGTIKFWKASESDRIFSGFQINLMFDLFEERPMNLIFATKDAKSVVCDGNCDLLYTAIIKTGSQRN